MRDAHSAAQLLLARMVLRGGNLNNCKELRHANKDKYSNSRNDRCPVGVAVVSVNALLEFQWVSGEGRYLSGGCVSTANDEDSGDTC